jgi:hypothetical protein
VLLFDRCEFSEAIGLPPAWPFVCQLFMPPPYSAILPRAAMTSSTRQRVVASPSFTGLGNLPLAVQRQIVEGVVSRSSAKVLADAKPVAGMFLGVAMRFPFVETLPSAHDGSTVHGVIQAALGSHKFTNLSSC